MLSTRLTSSLRFALTAALLLGSTLSTGGCAAKRWQSAERIAYAGDGSSQAERFAFALARVRSAGYTTEEIDAERGFLRVRARYGDGGVLLHGVTWSTPGAAAYGVARGTSTQSWLTLEVATSGRMVIDAQGFAVRDRKGTIHRKLRTEMDAFAAIVSGAQRLPPRQVAAVSRSGSPALE